MPTNGIHLPLWVVLFTISLSLKNQFMLNLNGSFKVSVFMTSPSTKKKFVLNLPLRKELNTEVKYLL